MWNRKNSKRKKITTMCSLPKHPKLPNMLTIRNYLSPVNAATRCPFYFAIKPYTASLKICRIRKKGAHEITSVWIQNFQTKI